MRGVDSGLDAISRAVPVSRFQADINRLLSLSWGSHIHLIKGCDVIVVVNCELAYGSLGNRTSSELSVIQLALSWKKHNKGIMVLLLVQANLNIADGCR